MRKYLKYCFYYLLIANSLVLVLAMTLYGSSHWEYVGREPLKQWIAEYYQFWWWWIGFIWLVWTIIYIEDNEK